MKPPMSLPGPGTHWIFVPVRWIFWSGVGAMFWAGALWLAVHLR